MIIRLRDYADTEIILERAYTLKGTQFGMDRDYPKEIADARKFLYKSEKAKNARYRRQKNANKIHRKVNRRWKIGRRLLPRLVQYYARESSVRL